MFVGKADLAKNKLKSLPKLKSDESVEHVILP